MSLKKTYLASKPECKVTFRLEKDSAINFSKVSLVGDFNNWNEKANPMKKLKNGDFTATLNLPKGNKYQFKYLADKTDWINDSQPDAFVTNEFQGKNCVVAI